ncbi:putative LPS assembly protein LptD [Tenacibaculum sp. M341]|uniref:putative LPS assembly protein LptD n=1 Tax=Tenacibaculum sp. M341 TaxID=2530339 RepID=UPI001A9E1AF5|nr:putative LPS assembly protein LptD [Tenacibaculum sp. M341]
MKANSSYILLFLFLFCFKISVAQEGDKKGIPEQLITKKDSAKVIKEKTNFSIKNDSVPVVKTDSIPKDSIIKPKEVIDYIVTHDAEDYTIQNAKNKTVTLYNNARVVYGDVDLKAGKIIVNYKNNTVYATGIKDSTGYVQRPVFKQGNQESEQDSILFNFKTEKALIYGIKTVQGEMITYGEKTKRVNDSTIYMSRLRFTTSKKKRPDYHIATNKAKLVPGKKIIVGASNLVISDVPTPLYLPFAYFPLTQERTSGFIIPSWGENNQQGFFLQNGGYYFAISDYFDLQVTGDVYSNGSWAINTNTNYKVRYKYSGGLSFRFQNLTTSIKGFSDFSQTSNYNLSWNHRQDTKSSPNSSLTARVNISSSSQFFRQSLNEIDQNQRLNNSFNSSITYSKKFVGTPFNMTTSITHNQNSTNEIVNMTLPNLQINMDRIYPLAGKGGIKKNPIQKIGVTYNSSTEYRIRTTEDNFLTSRMFEGARSGVQHNASANTNIKAFKYFTLSPNVSYKDVWYFNRIQKRYDPTFENNDDTLGAAVNDTISGFNRFNEYNFGVSLSTNVYGTFNFKKGRLKAIRHTIRPTVSWSYRPNFAEEFEQTVQSNADGDMITYNQFEGGIYGTPGIGTSNLISMSVNNVLEAKVAPKDDDDSDEDKKITLLNNLNFSTSYDITKDSLRWSNVSFSAGTQLFKNKMAVNLSGNLDPYQINDQGVRINKFNKDLFRLNSATLTANYSFSSKDFEDDKGGQNNNNQNNNPNNPPDVFGSDVDPTNGFVNRQPSTSKEPIEEEAELYKAKVPWDLALIYSANYSNNGINNAGIQTHTLGFSGNVELTPKWKVGFRSSYDIKNGAFSYTTMNFSRDLDSWRFNFNWVPFGNFTSYNFFIGVKSSMLSDLKWDKRQPPDRRLF